MGRRASYVLAVVLLICASPALAQVTLHTSTEQIPLKAYAQFRNTGVLMMSSGSFKDIPTINDFQKIRVSLTGWVPGRAMVASPKLFEDERAERRLVSISSRKVGVTAHDVRIADFERPDRIAELLKGVGAETGAAAYFFFVLVGESDGMVRYYPFKMNASR